MPLKTFLFLLLRTTVQNPSSQISMLTGPGMSSPHQLNCEIDPHHWPTPGREVQALGSCTGGGQQNPVPGILLRGPQDKASHGDGRVAWCMEGSGLSVFICRDVGGWGEVTGWHHSVLCPWWPQTSVSMSSVMCSVLY